MDGFTPKQSPIGSPPSNAMDKILTDDNPLEPPHTFILAPGGERTSQSAKNVLVMDYLDDFPELPGNPPPTGATAGVWRRAVPTIRAVRTDLVTQVFHLPAEERVNKSLNKSQFGNSTEEQQKCNAIALSSDTTIELSESKDQTLTILISGKRVKVEEARTKIIRELQTQAHRELAVPKEHHRVLIGKEGLVLRQLEADTDCRILIPGRENASDFIKVIGPREGIEKALHQIQLISDEQSKLAQEHLLIPRIYYPWIRGPFNEVTDKLALDTGAKINIPPPSAKSEMIVVTGEKEGVYKAARIIRGIFAEKEQIAKSMTCKVARSQHRFVVGPQKSGLADILQQTGVSVEVPPEEEDNDTLTLRGDPAHLGEALSLVYKKASSIVRTELQCPVWLHKYLIGPKGQTLLTIVPNKNKLQIDFEHEGIVYLEGPPEEVKSARESLSAATLRLQDEMAIETVKVPPNYHRHIIGKGGTFGQFDAHVLPEKCRDSLPVSKIKSETGVQISIPNEATNSDEIKVEGSKEGVLKAAKSILELVKRMENEKSLDVIVEQRLHRYLLANKRELVNKLKDRFPGVTVNFPETGRKSDIVTLRGHRTQVDECHRALLTVIKQLRESHFELSVHIFKQFHSHVIGKAGVNIRRIRDETNTRIELPGEDSQDGMIVVIGKKDDVQKAVDMLTRIQNVLEDLVTLELKIAAKIHSRLLGGGRRLIQDIQDECGGVQIRFPSEKSNSDKVIVRGPKEDAEKAKELLLNLAKDRELSSFEDSVDAKHDFHRFLIGKGGAKIKMVRKKHPDVRVLFPRESDHDKDKIHLVGSKDQVGLVKIHLEQAIQELLETTELTVSIPVKWRRHFVQKGFLAIREIQDQFGGVTIRLPPQSSDDSTALIKGSRQCAQGAKLKIESIVQELEAQVTIHVNIAAEFHRLLLSNRGQKVHEISAKYNVHIKFPERETRGRNADENVVIKNGQMEDVDEQPMTPENAITLIGRLENCELARDELLTHIPVTETLLVPFELHGQVIGTRGETVRSLMNTHDVSISIPAANLHNNDITVVGRRHCVDQALVALKELVDKLNADIKDRELRAFKLPLVVPVEYHQRLIGPKGQNINQLRAKFDVQISIPKQNNNKTESNEIIFITGYQVKAEECADEINAMIKKLRSLFTQEITIDARIHPRLIGQKGRFIRKIMDEYKVEVTFPRSSDPDPNLVAITGDDEDAVYDCVDHLRNIEEEYLQDIIDRHQYQSPSLEKPCKNVASDRSMSLQIHNAPWQVPDANNLDDFPAMSVDSNSNNNNKTSVGVWGGSRRF